MSHNHAAAPTYTGESAETQLAFAGLGGQAQLLADGVVSSRDLVELALQRIEEAQPRLNAFRVICVETALAAAGDADRRLAAGESAPLLGVPVAIKDDVDLAGETTPFGCGGAHTPATKDAELVRRLRAAGAIVIGKTQAPEVGQWHFTESPAFGATRNPWNTDHTPGGSSGGAAAAVAAGLVAAAIGSDGAGSVRIPAAWTGLVGLKPQRGRISTWPDAEAFNGLACFGPLTRSIADAALLLDVVAGSREGDLHRPAPHSESYALAASRPPRRLRIALSFATPIGVPGAVDPEIRAAIELTATRLTDLGHEVIRTDPSYGLVGASIVPRGMAGVRSWIDERVPEPGALEARTRVHARCGRVLSGPALRAARAIEPALARRIGRVFERVDVVLTPTTAKPAPRIGALQGRGYWATSTTASAICPYAWAWNVIGWPALSVPAGFTEQRLPIGAQLLGRENDEATLLALGAELEAAEDGEWMKLRPAQS
ncbi:MAG TPA: amidase [Solirubrobacteraceae bacterium]|nr:amidase [Solirubrobacteraceae bacterium]